MQIETTDFEMINNPSLSEINNKLDKLIKLMENKVENTINKELLKKLNLIEESKNGHKETVELLLNSGADPNIQNKFGQTALIMASCEGHTEIIELLLNSGADPNIQNKFGRTALYCASCKEYKEIVELLLKANADPNIQDKKGGTAYYVAQSKDIKDLLKEYQTKVNPNKRKFAELEEKINKLTEELKHLKSE